jgi:hypothetical protein
MLWGSKTTLDDSNQNNTVTNSYENQTNQASVAVADFGYPVKGHLFCLVPKTFKLLGFQTFSQYYLHLNSSNMMHY